MAHSDDDGLVLPPKVAACPAVIVPIFKTPEEQQKVAAFIDKLLVQLVGEAECAAAKNRGTDPALLRYFFDKLAGQSILVDWRDNRPGDKHFHWEQRGVPLRIEAGPRDVDSGSVMIKKRLDRSKEVLPLAAITSDWLRGQLDTIQKAMFDKARAHRDANIREAGSYDELKKLAAEGGFVKCWFTPNKETEAKIKEETKATVRCVPFEQSGTGKDVYTGAETTTRVIFAQSY